MKIHSQLFETFFYILIILTLFLTSDIHISSAQSFLVDKGSAELTAFPVEIYEVGDPIYILENQTNQRSATNIEILLFPTDPQADIPWSCDTSSVADIECAFNAARSAENNQLGTSLPMLSLPNQSDWDDMSDGEKAIWLINRERIDRGIIPLHGLETNVTDVAQSFAQYLIDNNAFDHNADGRSPWERLEDNPSIGVCHDFLNVAENIAVFWTNGSFIPLPTERSVYLWMYVDAGFAWGHRQAILWYPYNDNSGPMGKEGFLGIGRASGPHNGWNFAELIVMDVFDPCSTWKYPSTNRIGLPWLIPLLLN